MTGTPPESVLGLVLTLERAHARKAQVERIVRACPVPCHPLLGVDGWALSAAERDVAYRRHLHAPRYPFALRPGEIGCFLSHRRAWQRLLDSDASAALIVEDDVQIESRFEASLAFAARLARPGDYLQLPAHRILGAHARVATEGKLSLLAPVVVPLRATAQLVTREAARRLLACTERFDRPVDTFLQMTWITGVPVRIVVPSGVREVSGALDGSTIFKGRKTLAERLRREILRPAYRLRIALLSRRYGGGSSLQR